MQGEGPPVCLGGGPPVYSGEGASSLYRRERGLKGQELRNMVAAKVTYGARLRQVQPGVWCTSRYSRLP